jgi:hypothetical protein
MVDVATISSVDNALRKPTYYADAAFRLPQEKKAGIGRYHAAVKVSRHFFPAYTWKLKLKLVIFFQAASLVLVNFSQNPITSKEAALLFVCQVFIRNL